MSLVRFIAHVSREIAEAMKVNFKDAVIEPLPPEVSSEAPIEAPVTPPVPTPESSSVPEAPPAPVPGPAEPVVASADASVVDPPPSVPDSFKYEISPGVFSDKPAGDGGSVEKAVTPGL